MKIYLDTIGCRLNQAEIETMAGQFRAAGHEIAAFAAEADLVVINTCTVTAQAASDSRQKARQAVRQGAREIVLTGCWSTLEPEQALNLPNVLKIIPNDRKENLVSELLTIPPSQFELEPLARKPLPGSHKRTRAFIKVQDGCDNHCTYCITTIARGVANSRSRKSVIGDIQAALLGGSKEVVLTGVHLGAWGLDSKGENGRLRDLIRTILNETDVPRLRLSSLEPWDLDDEFFNLWEDVRLCRHLHLPLQSGSKSVLRRMARKTTPEAYSDLIISIRSIIPDIAITTDLIAGFPGETELEFGETLEFVERMGFSGGHVFTYSARPGTTASRMPGHVPPEIRKKRNEKLRNLLAISKDIYTQNYIGKSMNVLWESSIQESVDSWKLEGLTDNYLIVQATSSQSRWNQIDCVELTALEEEKIFGKIKFPL